MKNLEMSPELKALLESTPILSEQDVKELGDAVAALDTDPEFVADCIKGDFVNDILHEMAVQGLNNNQLAKKWGRSRQHVGKILDKEKSKNFTIDTIVSLSMTLGLAPQRIELKKMTPDAIPVRMNLFRPLLDLDLSNSWCDPGECVCGTQYVAERPVESYQAAPEKEILSGMAA